MDSHTGAEKAQMDFGKYAHLLSQTFQKDASAAMIVKMTNDQLCNPKCGCSCGFNVMGTLV